MTMHTLYFQCRNYEPWTEYKVKGRQRARKVERHRGLTPKKIPELSVTCVIQFPSHHEFSVQVLSVPRLVF